MSEDDSKDDQSIFSTSALYSLQSNQFSVPTDDVMSVLHSGSHSD